ncbi:MAG: transporter substrate-binding domain-containing protein [Mogibacterium sp.]|nr:transporter substrate-binding domain-containing protein [Mogibacterium sp.]
MKNTLLKKLTVCAISILVVFSLAACGGGSSSSDAGSEGSEGGGKLAAIQEAGKLVVCTDAAWAPFEYIGANGEPTGVDIEIANKIAEALGVELEIMNIAFDTIPATLASGDADLALACITITDERKEEMDFSVPYTTVQQYMVVPADSKFETMDDLAGQNVGTHLGTTGDFLMEEEINNGVLKGKSTIDNNKQYKALPDAASELKSGTLGAVVCDSVLAENLVKANGDAFKCFPVKYADGKEADVEQIGVAMKKGDAELLAKVDEIVQPLIDDGSIEKFYVKHSEEASKL